MKCIDVTNHLRPKNETPEKPKITVLRTRTFGKWRVDVVEEEERILVRFYDMSVTNFENGQFVSSYYLETLVGKGMFSDTNIGFERGFCLWADVPSWTIEQPELAMIGLWLAIAYYELVKRVQ